MSVFVFKFHFKLYCRWASQSPFGQQFLRIYNNYIVRSPVRINKRKLYLAIIFLLSKHNIYPLREYLPQIAKFMGPTWDPPGSCRPPVGPMLAPWTLLSGTFCTFFSRSRTGVFFLVCSPYPSSAPAWLDQQFNRDRRRVTPDDITQSYLMRLQNGMQCIIYPLFTIERLG